MIVRMIATNEGLLLRLEEYGWCETYGVLCSDRVKRINDVGMADQVEQLDNNERVNQGLIPVLLW